MRKTSLVALIALVSASVAPTLAAAQHSAGSGSPMGDLLDLDRFATRGVLNQWSATRPARLSGLSPEGRVWLKQAVVRQATAPRSAVEVARSVEVALTKDIHEIAREQNARPDDVAHAFVLKIMIDTKNALSAAAWRAHKVAEPGAPSWDARIAQAETNRRDAMKLQSDVSLAMAMD